LVNAIETSTGGRALGTNAQQQLRRELNSNANLRVKSSHGNGVVDERRDARIAHAFKTNTSIKGKSTAARAHQALQQASTLSNPKFKQVLGNMRVHNASTGRTHLLKNHTAHAHRSTSANKGSSGGGRRK
jgi:hypothetical protein